MLINTEKRLRQLKDDGVNIFRKYLKKEDKVATAFTSNSIRGEVDRISVFQYTLTYYADESYDHIINGRPAGAGFPPSIFSRRGLRLNLWFGARGIERTKSTDFLIRRAIDEKGIEGVDVKTPAVEELEKRMDEQVIESLKNDLFEYGLAVFQNAIKD